MALATVPYRIQIDHDGKKYDVHIPALSVPKCANCGALSIDDAASEQIDNAFRQEANLLTPAEIRQGRIDAGFPQQEEFAKCFGVGVSTVSRWETGAQVQQRFHDGMLRAFFEIAELRTFLAALHGVRYVGSRVVRFVSEPISTWSVTGQLIEFPCEASDIPFTILNESVNAPEHGSVRIPFTNRLSERLNPDWSSLIR
jgi:DNA-binding transcriptional regulator YiaG